MEKSLDPNVPEHQGWTPFSRGARQGDVKTVEWLLTSSCSAGNYRVHNSHSTDMVIDQYLYSSPLLYPQG
jgi:hypothetical protein